MKHRVSVPLTREFWAVRIMHHKFTITIHNEPATYNMHWIDNYLSRQINNANNTPVHLDMPTNTANDTKGSTSLLVPPHSKRTQTTDDNCNLFSACWQESTGIICYSVEKECSKIKTFLWNYIQLSSYGFKSICISWQPDIFCFRVEI